MRSITCKVVIVGLLAGAASADQGTHFFFPPGSVANWDTADVWRESCDPEAPLAGFLGEDSVPVICAGKTCNMNVSDRVNAITVEDTAILNILSGNTLRLDKDGGTSIFEGTVNLTGEIHLEWEDDPGDPSPPWVHTFTGDGYILGTASGAKLLIQKHGLVTRNDLIHSTTIRGILEIAPLPIVGTDDFGQELILKGGTIQADAAGTLSIRVSHMSDDADASERSLLKVSTSSSAILQLYTNCLGETPLIPCQTFCLQYTDAEVLEGTLDLDVHLLTEGDLTMEPGGIIDVADVAIAQFRLPECL